MKKTLLICSALFLASGIAVASEKAMTTKDDSFSTLDTNKDQLISKAEVSANKTLSAQFQAADANNDGNLDQSEYNTLITLSGTASNQ